MANGPGVIMTGSFVHPSSSAYGGYIDYMNRNEAVRNQFFDTYNAISKLNRETAVNYLEGANEAQFSAYNDYMSNPEKTDELFSSHTDQLTSEEVEELKEYFKEGQVNESPMWQIVFSFTDEWLEEQGILNRESNSVNKELLYDATRTAISELEKKEGLNGKWTGAIHYNTDHLHIHVGYVERESTRELIDYINPHNMAFSGTQRKGKFKQKSVNATKSKFVNTLIDIQKELALVDEKLNAIVSAAKEESRSKLSDSLTEPYLKLYHQLPNNRRMWSYGYGKNQGFKQEVDDIVSVYLNSLGTQELTDLIQAATDVSAIYERTYGNPQNKATYLENKIYGENGLYHRLGNVVINEIKEFDKNQQKLQKLSGQVKPVIQDNLQKINDGLAIPDNSYFDSLEQSMSQTDNSMEASFYPEELPIDELAENFNFSPHELVIEEKQDKEKEVLEDVFNQLEDRLNQRPVVSPIDRYQSYLEDLHVERLEQAIANEQLLKKDESKRKSPLTNQEIETISEGLKESLKQVTNKPKSTIYYEFRQQQLTSRKKELSDKQGERYKRLKNGPKEVDNYWTKYNLDRYSFRNQEIIIRSLDSPSVVFSEDYWSKSGRTLREDAVPAYIVLFDEDTKMFYEKAVFDIEDTYRDSNKKDYFDNGKKQGVDGKEKENKNNYPSSYTPGNFDNSYELKRSVKNLVRELENNKQDYLNMKAHYELKWKEEQQLER